jgi:putative lipoprotein (rSAM/lipoprotein system)
MKVRFNRWYNAVLTALLTLLGYGCSSSSDDSDVEMYGVLASYYVIQGSVTDEAGKPIQGIKTSLKHVIKELNYVVECYDSVQTDVAGQYQLEFSGFHDPNLKLIVEDIDGDANGGTFAPDTLDLDYDKAIRTEWKSQGFGIKDGKYELQIDVKLKKK